MDKQAASEFLLSAVFSLFGLGFIALLFVFTKDFEHSISAVEATLITWAVTLITASVGFAAANTD